MSNERPQDSPSTSQIMSLLQKRKPDTKYRLVLLLAQLGDSWHSVDEIKAAAIQQGIIVSHLFENLIELARNDLVINDLKINKTQKQTNFRIAKSRLKEIQSMM